MTAQSARKESRRRSTFRMDLLSGRTVSVASSLSVSNASQSNNFREILRCAVSKSSRTAKTGEVWARGQAIVHVRRGQRPRCRKGPVLGSASRHRVPRRCWLSGLNPLPVPFQPRSLHECFSHRNGARRQRLCRRGRMLALSQVQSRRDRLRQPAHSGVLRRSTSDSLKPWQRSSTAAFEPRLGSVFSSVAGHGRPVSATGRKAARRVTHSSARSHSASSSSQTMPTESCPNCVGHGRCMSPRSP